MQNETKLMEMTVYLLIFCMAVTLFLFSSRSLGDLILTAKNEMSRENVFYDNYRTYDQISINKTTYAELLAMLFRDLDYDIQINDITILKENYNYQSFDFSVIPKVNFIKSYEYDAKGNIVRVVFRN